MPNSLATIWKTQEGVEIPIARMASTHLLATIHLIERKRVTALMETAARISVDPNDPEHDAKLWQYYQNFPPQYEALLAEAERRRLIRRRP